jgi:hypothetical protein
VSGQEAAGCRKLGWLAVRLPIGLLVLGFVIVLAGCGSTRPAAPTYSPAATASCLTGKGLAAKTVKDPSLQGTLGDLEVSFSDGAGTVDLAFGRTRQEARSLEQHAIELTQRALHRRGLELSRAVLLTYVRLDENVFYYSPDGPITEVVNRTISGCLRS